MQDYAPYGNAMELMSFLSHTDPSLGSPVSQSFHYPKYMIGFLQR